MTDRSIGFGRRVLALALGVVGVVCAFPALAQQWPSRPIKIVVGFAPGGGSDAVARILAAALADDLKTPVVVDNKAGAGGVVGTDFVAKAPPDGYTLHLATAGSYTIAPALRKLPYDPDKDLQPVSLLVTYPNFLVATASSGISSVADLIAKARATPGQLNFASSGNGTTPHLAFEYLNMQSGIRVAHVPYKGNGPAIVDLLGGQVPLMVGDPGPLMTHIQAGKLKVLGVTTRQRSPLFPGIPTIAESGVPGYDVSLWLGITGPAGMPPAVVARLNQAIEKALANKDVADKIVAGGMDVAYGGPAQLARLMSEERARWAEVIKRNNITE